MRRKSGHHNTDLSIIYNQQLQNIKDLLCKNSKIYYDEILGTIQKIIFENNIFK